MDSSEKGTSLKDNGGTRSGRDRRKTQDTSNRPERRSEGDRRSGVDRRNRQRNRGGRAVERREAFRKKHIESN